MDLILYSKYLKWIFLGIKYYVKSFVSQFKIKIYCEASIKNQK